MRTHEQQVASRWRGTYTQRSQRLVLQSHITTPAVTGADTPANDAGALQHLEVMGEQAMLLVRGDRWAEGQARARQVLARADELGLPPPVRALTAWQT